MKKLDDPQKPVPEGVVTPAITQCGGCGGTVDQYPHHMQCRDCGAETTPWGGTFYIRREDFIQPDLVVER